MSALSRLLSSALLRRHCHGALSGISALTGPCGGLWSPLLFESSCAYPVVTEAASDRLRGAGSAPLDPLGRPWRWHGSSSSSSSSSSYSTGACASVSSAGGTLRDSAATGGGDNSSCSSRIRSSKSEGTIRLNVDHYWVGLAALEQAYGKERLGAIRELLRTSPSYEQPVVLYDASGDRGNRAGRFRGALKRLDVQGSHLIYPVLRIYNLSRLAKQLQPGALLRPLGFDSAGDLRVELVHGGGGGERSGSSSSSSSAGSPSQTTGRWTSSSTTLTSSTAGGSIHLQLSMRLAADGDWHGLAALEQAYGFERMDIIRQSLLQGPYAVPIALYDASSGRTIGPFRGALVKELESSTGGLPCVALRIQELRWRMQLQPGAQLRLQGLAADGRTLVAELLSTGEGAGSVGSNPPAPLSDYNLTAMQLDGNSKWRGVCGLTQAFGNDMLLELERGIRDSGRPYRLSIAVLGADGARRITGRYKAELRSVRMSKGPSRTPCIMCLDLIKHQDLQPGAQLLLRRWNEETRTLEVVVLH